jgi:hypothetical protein
MAVVNDFVTALAQLLVNPRLQETFSRDPQAAADLLTIANEDRDLLVSLSPAQLERQARLLITKRMRETFGFLPLTVKALGENAAAYFRDYAQGYWPATHRRHTVDALGFCKFLREHRLPCNQSEYNRVYFNNKPSRMRICFAKDALINGRRRCALQLLYRLKGRHGEWCVYFNA